MYVPSLAGSIPARLISSRLARGDFAGWSSSASAAFSWCIVSSSDRSPHGHHNTGRETRQRVSAAHGRKEKLCGNQATSDAPRACSWRWAWADAAPRR